MISDIQSRRGGTISIQQILILSYLQSMRRLTLEEFTQLLRLPASRIRPNLELLVEQDIIEAHGTRTQRDYTLSQRIYKAQNNPNSYLRQASTDKSALKKEVLKMAGEPGGVTTRFLIKNQNLTKSQANRILKNMSDLGELIREGSGRSTHYIINYQKKED